MTAGILCLMAAAWSAAHAAGEAPPRETRLVLLVTLDGMRWQEVFGGADEQLIDPHQGVRDVAPLRQRFWRATVAERRAALWPFFWRVVAREGQVFGDPDHGGTAQVTNGLNFSYPGYNELLTGRADPRIDSNDKRPNPNVTVLEWLDKQPGMHGRIAAFCSWDVFPFVINAEGSGIPVNAGWMPLDVAGNGPAQQSANELMLELPRVWPGVRYDVFTFQGANAYLRTHRPVVLYMALGEDFRSAAPQAAEPLPGAVGPAPRLPGPARPPSALPRAGEGLRVREPYHRVFTPSSGVPSPLPARRLAGRG